MGGSNKLSAYPNEARHKRWFRAADRGIDQTLSKFHELLDPRLAIALRSLGGRAGQSPEPAAFG
jgi:hypothetical protein